MRSAYFQGRHFRSESGLAAYTVPIFRGFFMADTVLITGISGFIAKHVALTLLNAGYHVRGTVRDARRGARVRDTLAAQGAPVGGLSLVTADLEVDSGWREAAEGCRFVQHIASPFPLQQPKGREDLVAAAREGALRVIDAALGAGAERVVMTSSMVAMIYRAGRPARMTVGEADWTDPEWPPATPYIISKTRAERAAWSIVEERGAREKLVTVNPGFVLGPLLDADAGTSLAALSLILKGAYPAVPPVEFPVVDVRDLAAVHVSAMSAQCGGRRLIASGETWSMAAMAREMRAAHPERARKIPTAVLPGFMVSMLAAFDPSLRTLRADLGVAPVADAGYVSALTGVTFRPAAEAVRAASESLLRFGVV
jgi:nucleoside-diphosphate-sugar epimerase